MNEGFVIEGGQEYYCSEDCLQNNMEYSEYLELYDEGHGDSYWTEWSPEEEND